MVSRARNRGTLLTAAAWLALGCERVDFSASLGPRGIRADGLTGQTARALVGRWFSTASAPSGAGADYTVETTWEFASDGTATRTVSVRTPVGQLIETGRTRAEWRAGAGALTLIFGPPSPLQILTVPYAIDYTIEGTILYLDGVAFLRVGP